MKDHSKAVKQFSSWSEKFKFPVSDEKLESDVGNFLSKFPDVDFE